ncbi:hypothetical protein [Streptomyces litchfieldiae]|uniref:Uncharacterized protein n=1 Tax=Streptomyces litchfieldiae TaxID=3075543 RepID=A0ABU2MYM4_9ACTN|nr:hypothetical protein [Streptomyces sp. DSM 44938]MDT0345908.1 hypothetical protein [Streptomyces sp. DSM 44938]
MTWHVHISEHTFEMLTGLGESPRGAVFRLFRRLEEDPHAMAVPMGFGDGPMYTAAFATGLLVVLINPENRRITPVQITSLD